MKENAALTLAEIARRTSGTLIGDEKKLITGICPLDEPDKDKISYFAKGNLSSIIPASVGGLFIGEAIEVTDNKANYIKVSDPYRALITLIPLFFKDFSPAPGISPKAEIDPSASIGENCFIGSFSVIGEKVSIGRNCVIHPHVVIYPEVVIGENSIIHSGAVIRERVQIGANSVVQNGAVIGADGFGYVPDKEVGLKAVPQVGTVVIADRVEIGANSCIDRATLGATRVGWSTKIDNLVQIGHNTKVGKLSILCGHVAVAGSCDIGDQVVLGGNAGVADHISITNNVRCAAKSGVSQSLSKSGDYAGYPAIPIGTYRRNQVIVQKLAEVVKELKQGKKSSD